ncbi:MAG: ABC-F family ATP-binding cassette domain-containing protein [Bacteroidota bacterium]|nr:ABC-F family ATP-binding cassette domain-containing protein [Bacteroidota bacterium]
MNYLLAENVTKSYGDRVLFSGLTLNIEEGQKIALIARNGEGKTSLMRILLGKDSAEGGTVRINKDIRFAYLPQEPELDNEKSVQENVFSGDNTLIKAVRAYEEAIELASTDMSDAAQQKMQDAANDMDALGAWDYEQQIKQILTRLKINDLDQPTATLSGGQRKRVALAQILIESPQLLLMDEPTNHLDVEMIEWLENYLSRSSIALLLVTHDRYFLDRVTNHILELEDGKLYRYQGSYASYLEKKAERVELEAKEVDKVRNLMRKELDWMRRQPKARTTKSKSRISAFYDLKERSQGKIAGPDVQLDVQMTRLGKKILECHKVSKRFGDKVILDDFSYVFQKGERIGIVGPNGVGKTTFLELLTGAQLPQSGYFDTGETVVFGYYKQTGLQLPDEKRAIEVVTDIAEVIPLGNGEVLTATKLLERFGFDAPRQYTHVGKLSGGEKRRLHLLTILVRNPNFLILDEPTNDLDLITLQTLEDFLLNFPGCLLIVSHDRYFLDKLSQHLFVFEGKGKVMDFNGSYSEYRDMILEEEKESVIDKSNIQKADDNAAKEAKKKFSYKEQKEYDLLEGEIADLEKKKSDLEAKFVSGEGDHRDFTKWTAELEKAKQAIEDKTARWMELSELVG